MECGGGGQFGEMQGKCITVCSITGENGEEGGCGVGTVALEGIAEEWYWCIGEMSVEQGRGVYK